MAHRTRPSRAGRLACPKPGKLPMQDDRVSFLQWLFSAPRTADNAADRRIQATMELNDLTMELA